MSVIDFERRSSLQAKWRRNKAPIRWEIPVNPNTDKARVVDINLEPLVVGLLLICFASVLTTTSSFHGDVHISFPLTSPARIRLRRSRDEFHNFFSNDEMEFPPKLFFAGVNSLFWNLINCFTTRTTINFQRFSRSRSSIHKSCRDVSVGV